MYNNLPEKEYSNIVEKMPVCCVDVVVSCKGKILLVCRSNEPSKGKWWFPGGRIYKNEKLQDAAIRKVFEEVGLKVKVKKELGAFEYFNDKSCFKDVNSGTHSINISFLTEVMGDNTIKVDKTSRKAKWIDKIEKDMDSYVIKLIKYSGVFKK